MLWWLVIGTGAPLAAVIGLAFGAVLARLDARRERSTQGLGDEWSVVILADRRRDRWGAAIAVAGWLCVVVLHAFATSVFAWWPFIVPFVGGVLGVCLVGLPSSGERALRTAAGVTVDHRRRSWLAFVSPVAASTGIAVFVVMVVTVLAAGAMSSPDDSGRFTQFTMPVGDGTAGTLFFGWYFGVPVLVGTMILAGTTWFWLSHGARTPIAAQGRFSDEFLRRQRASALLRIATAATCVVIGEAWALIARAAQLTITIPGTGAGVIEFGTSFAAIGSILAVAAYMLQGSGLALLVAVLIRRRLPALPQPTRAEPAAAKA